VLIGRSSTAGRALLLDDDFGSIVTAIRLGRRIYDNVRKAMGFIFAVHVPIAGLALLPLAFAPDEPLFFMANALCGGAPCRSAAFAFMQALILSRWPPRVLQA